MNALEKRIKDKAVALKRVITRTKTTRAKANLANRRFGFNNWDKSDTWGSWDKSDTWNSWDKA